MQQFIGYFTPTLDQLVGLGALLVVCAGLVSIGGAMRGRKRLLETDLIAGWAVASVTFTAAGGLIHVDFRWIALALLAAMGCAEAPSTPQRGGPPNVIVVLIDTLRADRLSSYGYERETSPHIDALAASGSRCAPPTGSPIT